MLSVLRTQAGDSTHQVRVDELNTRGLLEAKEPHRNERPPQVGAAEEIDPAPLAQHLGFMYRFVDGLDLRRGVSGCDLCFGSQFVEGPQRLLLLALRQKPSGRLGRERNSNEQDHDGDELDRRRDLPPFVVGFIDERAAHPGPPEIAAGDEEGETAGEKGANLYWRDLGRVARHSVLDNTDGEVGNDSSDRELDPFFRRDWVSAMVRLSRLTFNNDRDDLQQTHAVHSPLVSEAGDDGLEQDRPGELSGPYNRVHRGPTLRGETLGALDHLAEMILERGESLERAERPGVTGVKGRPALW